MHDSLWHASASDVATSGGVGGFLGGGGGLRKVFGHEGGIGKVFSKVMKYLPGGGD